MKNYEQVLASSTFVPVLCMDESTITKSDSLSNLFMLRTLLLQPTRYESEVTFP